MSDSPTPRGRAWRLAASVAALAVALAGFGGLLLPRMASDGIPATFQPRADDPVVIKHEKRRQCKKQHHQYRPVLINPADR